MIGSKIYHKEKIYSSLEWAKSELSNVPDGTLFLADFHEYTRGRQGRIWKSYPGQLIMTFVLKPKDAFVSFDKLQAFALARRSLGEGKPLVPSLKLWRTGRLAGRTNGEFSKKRPFVVSLSNQTNMHDTISLLESELNHLNMAVSLGILEPLKKFDVSLKWPNDFVLNNKKVGGVIFEVLWKNEKLEGIVVGFAINVNNVIPESDELHKIATSLKMGLGKTTDEKILFSELLLGLNKFYRKWLDGEFDIIFNSWKSGQLYLNQEITIHKKDCSVVSGIFYDVLTNGDLVLKNRKNEIENIPFYIVENISI